MTLISEVSVQVRMLFAAKQLSWFNRFDLTRTPSSLAENQTVGLDLDLWHQIQGRHWIRSERLPLMRLFRSITQHFAAFAQCWPSLATNLDIDLSSQFQGRHLDHSAKLPRLAPLLSFTLHNIDIANFYLSADLDLWGQTQGRSFCATPELWRAYTPKTMQQYRKLAE